MAERDQALSMWVPRTHLGKLVQEGKITSISDIFSEGIKIQESEIVDVLLPNLTTEVLNINLVQKQTDAGERSRFKAIVALGNVDGYIGLGGGKAKQVRNAIEKATTDAKLNIFPVRRGCGSWECGCGQPHSLPFRVKGKCGSVAVEIIPGPRGLGLVAGEYSKIILKLAGIKDCWTRSFGSTRTVSSSAYSTFEALKGTHRIVTPSDWVR
jgi:small subunit ribosomal protein S5